MPILMMSKRRCMMLTSAMDGVGPKTCRENSEANAWSLFAVHRVSTGMGMGTGVTVRKLDIAQKILRNWICEIAVDSRMTSIDTAKRLEY